MISLRMSAAIAGASLLLAACVGGPSATQNVTQSATRSGGLFGLSKNEAVMVDTGAAFKAADNVVIGNFVVGFVTEKTDSAKAGGGLTGNGFGGKSTAHSVLQGVDDATMQKITDAAYADFVAGLKAKGYKIADRSVLLNDEGFAKTKTYPMPYVDSKGGLFAGAASTKYFTPAAIGKNAHLFMGDIPGFTGGFGFSNPSTAAAVFAEKTGTRVLNAVYLVDFANADGYGGSFRSSSSISVGQGLSVVPENTHLGITGGHAGTFSSAIGKLRLGQPVTSSKAFATVDDATSGAYKTTETVTNVIGILGGIGSNAKRDYTFRARAGDYQAASLDALKTTSGKFLSTMTSLR